MAWYRHTLLYGMMTAFGYTQFHTWFGKIFLVLGGMAFLLNVGIFIVAIYKTFSMKHNEREQYEELLKKLKV